MSRWRRVGLAIFTVVLGLMIGFAIASAQHRITASRDPLSVEVGGSFGASVAVAVTGKADFELDDGLAEMTTTLEIAGAGRKIEEGRQVLARVSTFYLRQDGLVAQTGSRYYTGSAGANTLGYYADSVIGQTEGSRIVLLEPETRRSGIISVIDVLPTVLPGEPSDLEAGGGLPGVSTDGVGRPVVVGPGGEAPSLREATMIQGGGAQVEAGDTIVVNYLLVTPDGSVTENTWDAPAPVVMTVDDVFDGLRAGLEDARVGSRLVLAIPAGMAQGDADVGIIIDVLAKINEE